MHKNQIVSRESLESVALALGEINDEVVFVGGAVIALYVTDDGAEEPRPTKDIDISVQISSYMQMNRLREKLAAKNIYPASTESVIYRYYFEEILIDFIPFEETPLGPTNRWLKRGFQKTSSVSVGKVNIRVLPVSIFLATKWEAYKNRGGDPRISHDFEDIIYILDNNSDIVSDFAHADEDIQNFLKEMSQEILTHFSRNEIIECHINPIIAEKRREFIVHKLEQIQ